MNAERRRAIRHSHTCRCRPEPATARRSVILSHHCAAQAHSIHRGRSNVRYSITRLIVAGAISAGIAGVALAYPRWVMALGLDLWKLPDMNRQIVINLIFNEQ